MPTRHTGLAPCFGVITMSAILLACSVAIVVVVNGAVRVASIAVPHVRLGGLETEMQSLTSSISAWSEDIDVAMDDVTDDIASDDGRLDDIDDGIDEARDVIERQRVEAESQAAIESDAAAATTVTDSPTVATGDSSSDDVGSWIVEIARTRLGVPYVKGGTDWDHGMDCSGLTYQVYAHAGYDIPRCQSWAAGHTPETSQVALVRSLGHWKTSIDELEPGDIVFYGNSWDTTEHVGIYSGNGMNVEEAGDDCLERPVAIEGWSPSWHTFVGGGSPLAG